MNTTLAINKKIENEKRRRNQIYIVLDYLFSGLTYFDFFSVDSFELVKISKILSALYKKEFVGSDFLLLSFFLNSSQISIFNELGITSKNALNLILNQESIKNDFLFLKKIKFSFISLSFHEKIFSYETNFIFEKSAENALIRFKTPIITSDILLVTILEEKNTKAYKLLKSILNSSVKLYLLRYKLIKRIHIQESFIRNEVSKNQHYFAYLLKTQLKENELDKLIKFNNFVFGVSSFRNSLVSKILEINFFNLISKEINQSLIFTNSRKYIY